MEQRDFVAEILLTILYVRELYPIKCNHIFG